MSIHGRRGIGHNGAFGAPFPAPTTALPGTEEKVEVMAQRAERGERLFSPEDRTWENLLPFGILCLSPSDTD